LRSKFSLCDYVNGPVERVERRNSVEYIYIKNAFFVISHISKALMYIYTGYKSRAILIRLEIIILHTEKIYLLCFVKYSPHREMFQTKFVNHAESCTLYNLCVLEWAPLRKSASLIFRYSSGYTGPDQTSWSRGNALDLYLGGALFEYRPGRWQPWLRFAAIFLSPFRKLPDYNPFLPNPFHFILIHITSP
jgi:hypothetical protein